MISNEGRRLMLAMEEAMASWCAIDALWSLAEQGLPADDQALAGPAAAAACSAAKELSAAMAGLLKDRKVRPGIAAAGAMDVALVMMKAAAVAGRAARPVDEVLAEATERHELGEEFVDVEHMLRDNTDTEAMAGRLMRTTLAYMAHMSEER